MCLVTEQKIAEILTEDLTVYKRFWTDGKDLFPWSHEYREYVKYEVGKIHKQSLLVNNKEETFHDERSSLAYEDYWKSMKKLTHVHEGFHAVLTCKRLSKNRYDDYVDYVCTIPKGAKVFKDKTGLIVSDTIILKEKICA